MVIDLQWPIGSEQREQRDFADRIRGAAVSAGAARDAGRVTKTGVQAGRDVRVEPTPGGCQRERALYLVARAYATSARDAELMLKDEIWVPVVVRPRVRHSRPHGRRRSEPARHCPQLRVSARLV